MASKCRNRRPPPQVGGGAEVLAVPDFALIVDAAAGLDGQQLDAVGQGDAPPAAVVVAGLLGAGRTAPMETPVGIHGLRRTARAGKLVEPGGRKLRLTGGLRGGQAGQPYGQKKEKSVGKLHISI